MSKNDSPTTREQLVEAMARAMALTFEQQRDTPFELYDREAMALARAALSAIEAAGAAVVPVEATDAMVTAAIDREDEGTKAGTFYHAIYAAMVAARPTDA